MDLSWMTPEQRATFNATLIDLQSHWQETRRLVDGKVKVSNCCCTAPGWGRRKCADTRGNKTPCRCDCHRGMLGPGAVLGSIRYEGSAIRPLKAGARVLALPGSV